MKLPALATTSLAPLCLFVAACGAAGKPESGGFENSTGEFDARAIEAESASPSALDSEGASNMSQDASAATGRLHPVAYGYRELFIAVDTASIPPAEVRRLGDVAEAHSSDFARHGVEVRLAAFEGQDPGTAAAQCLRGADGGARDSVRIVHIWQAAGVTHVRHSRGDHRLDSTWPASLKRRDALAKLLQGTLHILESPATY